MSNIDGVNKNLFPHQLKNNERAGQSKEGKSKETSAGIKVNLTVRTNQLIIDMHLKIRIESKERFGTQAGVHSLPEFGGVDLSQFEFNGRPITDLSQEEAKALISEGGFFSVENTARRIFNFVAANAGDDLEKLQAARDAILKGFKEAEALFGGALPDISYDTIDKLLEMIDEKIRGLGGAVVDVNA